MKQNNLSFFNLLKIISACIISFFFHWEHLFVRPLKMNINSSILSLRIFQFLLHGPIGTLVVELFFIMSGFLFAYVYIPKIKKKEYSFDKFIFKRYVRIMPLVILTSSICYILTFIMRINSIECWVTFCGNNVNIVSLFFDFIFSGTYIFIDNFSLNSPIWYINVLLVCYILAYIITQIYIRFPNKSFFIMPIILGIIIFLKEWKQPLLTPNTARGYVAFFVGIILHFFINKTDEFSLQIKNILVYISLFILTISFGYIFFHFGDYSTLKYSDFISNLHVFFDFVVYPPLMYLLYNFKGINSICNTKFIKNLGKISYGIYLWNFPILGGMYFLIKFFELTNETIVKYYFLIWITIVILHFILSILSYNFVEKNFIIEKYNKR